MFQDRKEHVPILRNSEVTGRNGNLQKGAFVVFNVGDAHKVNCQLEHVVNEGLELDCYLHFGRLALLALLFVFFARRQLAQVDLAPEQY